MTGFKELYALWILSTLNHTGLYPPVRIIDITLAHTICVWGIMHVELSRYIYWLMCMWTIFVYKITGLSFLPGKTGEYWHASTHVASSIGMVHSGLNPASPLKFMALMSIMYFYLKKYYLKI
jgi:hypothetical protein